MTQIKLYSEHEDLGDVSEHLLSADSATKTIASETLVKPLTNLVSFPAMADSRLAEIRERNIAAHGAGLRERILSVAWNVYPRALDITAIFNHLDLSADMLKPFAKIGQELEEEGFMEWACNGTNRPLFRITLKGREHLLNLILFAGLTILDLEQLVESCPGMQPLKDMQAIIGAASGNSPAKS